MKVSDQEKRDLLLLAGRAIAKKVAPEILRSSDIPELTGVLIQKCGVFVSVYVDQELRGCIGTFSEDSPLFRNVENMAIAAALEDNRFKPLQASEILKTELEISILSPRFKIDDPREIILGRHGIYIRSGSRRGTFLPQVALAQNWSVEEFLGNCSRYKAGIGWDGWKTAELYIFEAFVFRSAVPSF